MLKFSNDFRDFRRRCCFLVIEIENQVTNWKQLRLSEEYYSADINIHSRGREIPNKPEAAATVL